jgi:hypothetical protein
MNFYQSLQSSPAVPTRSDHRVIRYPIMGKEAPVNPGRSGRSMQDIAEPVIPGSSKHREPLVEIASPYHIEVHEETTGDSMERPSQQAAPRSPLKHADSLTDASVVAANTTTESDVRPWSSAFGNASSSSANTSGERRWGGGGDGEGESGNGTHEREREWESEWERESARRAGE